MSPQLLKAFILFQVFIVPPLYRHQPSWYHRNLSQVASRFSQSLGSTPAQNLHLLPSFNCQDLCPDGVHLTPVSGLHYVIHIFDQTSNQLDMLQVDSNVQLVAVQESVRHHDDRLAYLEGRHDRLSVSHDTKLASDAEFRDWMINRSEESWLTIQGLPRLGQKGQREWQDAARKQVNDLFRLTLKLNKVHIEYKVIVVSNPLRFRTSGVPVLNVKLDSIEASKCLRELYSGFFRGHNPVPLPPHLKGVSVRNKVTKETRVRITILQQLGANYVVRNPGATIKVRGFDPRPTLLIIHPASGGQAGSGSQGSSSKLYNFIEAVTSLPSCLSDDNLSRIFGVIGSSYPGQLRNLFVILSDDDRDRCQGLVRRRNAPSTSTAPTVTFATAPSSGPSFAQAMRGQVATSGHGMELESGFLASLARPPPPPPPPRSASRSPSPSRRSLRSTPASRSPSPAKRGLKRRHLSSDSSTEPKRSRRAPSSSGSSSASSGSETSSSSSRYERKKKKSKGSKRGKSSKRNHRKVTTKSKSGKSGSGSGKSSSTKSREK